MGCSPLGTLYVLLPTNSQRKKAYAPAETWWLRLCSARSQAQPAALGLNSASYNVTSMTCDAGVWTLQAPFTASTKVALVDYCPILGWRSLSLRTHDIKSIRWTEVETKSYSNIILNVSVLLSSCHQLRSVPLLLPSVPLTDSVRL